MHEAPSINLKAMETDDPAFVDLVSRFVSHVAETSDENRTVRVIHIDNWFGRRWLGFSGKILGAAGVRNRLVTHALMPAPPFKPSRIQSIRAYYQYQGGFAVRPDSIEGLHADKPGDHFWHVTKPTIFCWYSGNTAANTNGSLMIYDITRHGSSGWYIGFDRAESWRVTTPVNISTAVCATIMKGEAQADF